MAVKEAKFLPRCARDESQTPKALVSLLRSATSLARLAAECSANSPAVRKEFVLDERFLQLSLTVEHDKYINQLAVQSTRER